jgi:hypothetical protein
MFQLVSENMMSKKKTKLRVQHNLNKNKDDDDGDAASDSSRLSIRDVDHDMLFGGHDYFRERSMRRAEREFGEANIRDEAALKGESGPEELDIAALLQANGLDGNVDEGENGSSLAQQPTLEALRDELNIQRTLMNRILTRLESGALFQARNGEGGSPAARAMRPVSGASPAKRVKSPERKPIAENDNGDARRNGSATPKAVPKNGAKPRSRTPSPAGITSGRSPQSARASAQKKKKAEQAPILPGAMPPASPDPPGGPSPNLY